MQAGAVTNGGQTDDFWINHLSFFFFNKNKAHYATVLLIFSLLKIFKLQAATDMLNTRKAVISPQITRAPRVGLIVVGQSLSFPFFKFLS